MNAKELLRDMIYAAASSGGGGYPEPEGKITINQNGINIDVKDYATADVSVPNTYEFEDEGKVVSDGDLVSQSSQTYTENNTYDTTLINSVTVNVSGGGASQESVILDRSITGAYENNDITELGTYALASCNKLTSVRFDNSWNIGEHALDSCKKIELITMPELTSVLTYGCFYVGANAVNPTVVNAPKLRSINANGFSNCRTIKSMSLPVLLYIATSGFEYCYALETVDCGYYSDLTKQHYIGATAFNGCSALTALILRDTTNTFILKNTSAFTDTPIASGTGYIYVPNALKATYQGLTNWSYYSSQFRSLESYTVDGTTTGVLDPSKI